MPSHKPRTRFAPTSTIAERPFINAVTMPSMICGIALTISTMIVGRFSMSAVKS